MSDHDTASGRRAEWYREQAASIAGHAFEKPWHFDTAEEILDNVRGCIESEIPEASAEDLKGVLTALTEMTNNRMHTLMGEAQEMNKLAARLERVADTL